MAYGEGLEGEAALAKGLGASTEKLQASFDAAIETRFAGLLAALRTRPSTDGPSGPKPQGNLAELKAAAEADPSSFSAQLALGRAMAEAGDKAAFEPLERAAALVPVATGEGSPHAVMGRLAEKLGDAPRAIKAYRALLDHDHTAIDAARRLAALAEKAGDEAVLRFAWDRVVALDPFDGVAHSGAGRLALKGKNAGIAAREFKAALATNVPDKAATHCDLAEAYLLAGRPADAKKEALSALEIAPTFERAQDLLLRSVEAK